MNKKQRQIGLPPETRVVLFQEKGVRRSWYKNEWWFAIVDVVSALTDSAQPEGYIKDLRRRDNELSQGWGQIATPLRIQTERGIQQLNCANTEGLLRIIQSIPSPKAEPFKRWLAQVGYERIKEIENPELATEGSAAFAAEAFIETQTEALTRSTANEAVFRKKVSEKVARTRAQFQSKPARKKKA